jgi:hypothetical protein
MLIKTILFLFLVVIIGTFKSKRTVLFLFIIDFCLCLNFWKLFFHLKRELYVSSQLSSFKLMLEVSLDQYHSLHDCLSKCPLLWSNEVYVMSRTLEIFMVKRVFFFFVWLSDYCYQAIMSINRTMPESYSFKVHLSLGQLHSKLLFDQFECWVDLLLFSWRWMWYGRSRHCLG